MKYILMIMFLALSAITQRASAQGEKGKTLEREVKTSGRYYYGEGLDVTLEASSKNALDDLKLMLTQSAMQSNSMLTSVDFKGFEDDIESIIFDLEGRYKVLIFVAKKDVEFQAINDKKIFIIRNTVNGVEIVTETILEPKAPEILLLPEPAPAPTEIVLMVEPQPAPHQPLPSNNGGNIDPIIKQLLPITQYEQARKILNNYKLEGRVMYGQLATLTSPHNCYFLVIKDDKIVDILDRSAGTERRSLKSGARVDYRTTPGVVLWIYIL